MRRQLRYGLAAALVLASLAAQAQKAAPPKPDPAKTDPAKADPATPPAEAPPPPYEPQLLRLAEIMGALTYLRELCTAPDGEQWRARMTAIIDAEAVSPARRQKLAGAYNRGFRGYEITYRSCTANAQAIIGRYLDEGARLAHDIGNRYGGG